MTNDLMNPQDFPSQPLPTSERVSAYSEEVNARGAALLQDWRPTRSCYGEDVSHKLDVFRRGFTEERRPALVFFHGGAWCSGYLWWSSFMAAGVADAGGILIAPTYRLGPRHRMPTQLLDVAAAIAWVWRNADDIGVDRSRIVVGGHSAGGHLSALAALHPTALLDAGMPEDAIRACFAISSSFNLHYPDAQPGSGEERVYRVLLARAEDAHAASPVNHVSAKAPFFHIVYGQRDFDRISRTSRNMAEILSNNGGNVEIEEWPGMDHFDTHLTLGDPAHAWYGALRRAFAAESRDTRRRS